MGRILKKGRNCWDIKRADTTGLVVDGRDYYRLFYHAALKARRYILIAGWQFDSSVNLLRGEDMKEAKTDDVGFLDFLNTLCRREKELRIYILAWDFSLLFAMEREWIQELRFNWATSERLFFHFDNSHAIGASQHQKFAVIDGSAAFIGGMDICAGRWDDRRHLANNPDRVDSDGTPYVTYHDVHSYHTGRLASKITELFKVRWKDSTGNTLDLPPPCKGNYLPENAGIAVPAHRVGLSRTQGQTLILDRNPVREIRSLYIDAIMAAKGLIYIENQYFSSYAVYRALLDRLKAPGLTRLEVIIILPKRPKAFLEEVSVWIAQSKLLNSLTGAARSTGHSIGIYYPVSHAGDGGEVPVYVHSKLLLVDDRFLTIGSANTTNRSMGFDTELNVSWEAGYRRHFKFKRTLRELRAGLISEHCGIPADTEEYGRLARPEGLVEFLNKIAEDKHSRLRPHALDPVFRESAWLRQVLESAILDPERAIIEENLFELTSYDMSSLFAEGITLLKKWLEDKGKGFI